jgi:hypothetical protein
MQVMFFFLMTLSVTAVAAPSTAEIQEATASIRALIRPLLPGAKENKKTPTELKGFRLDTCEKHKVDWMSVLMMKSELTLRYTFKTGCDIEGSVKPRVFQPFPAEFKLKNLKNYSSIAAQNRITATMETKPILRLEQSEGLLKGPKGSVKFTSDYRVQIDPMKGKNPIEKNLGGVIHITEIYGKKVDIKEKIRVE